MISLLSLFANSCLFANESMGTSKDDVVKSLDMLKSIGKISASDYDLAVKELKAMDDSKFNQIKANATNMVNSNPEAASKMVDQFGIK